MREILRRRRGWLEAFGWAISAIGYVAFAHLLWQAIARDGGFAYDLDAYLRAGRHVLDGAPLYGNEPMGIGDPGAYRYPPAFALLAAPLAALPEEVVTWTYRAACLGCLRALVGSWRAVGWTLLLPPVQIELVVLNVTLPIAAAARLALRGPGTRVGAALLPATAALKFGTALLVAYLWLTRPALRRPVLLGAVGLAAAFAAHASVDPGAWRDYLASLAQQSASVNDAPWVGDQLLFVVPSILGDFVVRLAIGALLVAAALRGRHDWLAYAAAAIAVPTLWLARLAALVGVPRLWWEQRSAASDGPASGPSAGRASGGAEDAALSRVPPDEGGAHRPSGQPVQR